MRRWYEHRIPPPVIDLACAGAMAWLAGAVPAARLWPPGGAWWVWVLALGLATVGALVALAGLIEFRRARTTFNPLAPQRARTVVTSGVYRLTRNPMYLGMALLQLGWCFWLGQPLALLAPALFVAYITRFQIQPEERALRAKFGAPYEAYLRRVRRWL